MGQSIPVDIYRMSRPATLYAETLFSDRPIGQFLERLFPVAEFSASTSCDNCEGFQSGVRFMVSALDTWDYRTVNLNLQRNSLEWRVMLDAGYRVPAGVPHTPARRRCTCARTPRSAAPSRPWWRCPRPSRRGEGRFGTSQ